MILALGLLVSTIGFMSCDDSAQKAREKAIADSLALDSTLKAEAAIRLADSLRQDSILRASVEEGVTPEETGHGGTGHTQTTKGGTTTTTETKTGTTEVTNKGDLKTGDGTGKGDLKTGGSGKDKLKGK